MAAPMASAPRDLCEMDVAPQGIWRLNDPTPIICSFSGHRSGGSRSTSALTFECAVLQPAKYRFSYTFDSDAPAARAPALKRGVKRVALQEAQQYCDVSPDLKRPRFETHAPGSSPLISKRSRDDMPLGELEQNASKRFSFSRA